MYGRSISEDAGGIRECAAGIPRPIPGDPHSAWSPPSSFVHLVSCIVRLLFNSALRTALLGVDCQTEAPEISVKGQAGHIIEQVGDYHDRERITIGEFFVL